MCAHHGRRWPSPWPSRTQAIQEATDLEGWVLGALTLAPGRASTVGSAAASGSPPATPTGTASSMRFAAGCSTTPPSPSPSDRASLGGVVMARTTKHEAELYRERQVPKKQKQNAVAGDRTRVARVTGGNTHHYTTTTLLLQL